MQIWPAIDLRGGKCVRLQQGDYGRETIFGDDPAEMARQFVSQGAEYLHLVDLDGAREGQPVNVQAIGAIRKAVDIVCELGGGVRDEASIAALFDLGMDRVVIGTRALKEPDWLRQMCKKFPGRLVLGIDARGGRVATHGWRETSDTKAVDMARSFQKLPLAAIVFTDIAQDGMLAGPNLQALSEMKQGVRLPVIASGGVTLPEHVAQLAQLGLAGAIIGRALYEGKITLAQALAAAAGN